MPRPKKVEIWATLARLLGENACTLRQAAAKMDLSFHRADYYRKVLTAKGEEAPGPFLTHVKGGAYLLTGKGERLVDRWGRRETSEGPENETSETTATGNLRDHREDGLNFWEVHNTRFSPPVLRVSRPLEASRHLGATPILARKIFPPHPQDPTYKITTSLEVWGNPPSRARFYVNAFALLAPYNHILVLQEDLARGAIREAKEAVGIGLPRTPEGFWTVDPLGRTSTHPLPSGHARLALPELQGVIRELVRVSAASIMDSSPGPGWETGDVREGHEADLLFQALRTGRVPDDILALKESHAALRNALLSVSDRLGRLETRDE